MIENINQASPVQPIAKTDNQPKQVQQTQEQTVPIQGDSSKLSDVKKGVAANSVSFATNDPLKDLPGQIKDLHQQALVLEQEINTAKTELDNFDQNALAKIKNAEADLARIKSELGAVVDKAKETLDITIREHRANVNQAEANLREAQHPGILDLEKQIGDTKDTIGRIENKIADINKSISNGQWKIEQAVKDKDQAAVLNKDANRIEKDADAKGSEAQKHEIQAERYTDQARPYKESAERYDNEYKRELNNAKHAGKYIYMIAEGHSYNHNSHSDWGIGFEPDYEDEWRMQRYIGEAHDKIIRMNSDANNYDQQAVQFGNQLRTLQDKKVEIQVKINTTTDPTALTQLKNDLTKVNTDIDSCRNKESQAKNKAIELRNEAKFREQDLWRSESEWKSSISSAKYAKQSRDNELENAREYEDKASSEENIAGNFRSEEKQLRGVVGEKREKADTLTDEAHTFETEGPQQVQNGQRDLKIETSNLTKEQTNLKNLEYKKEHLPAGKPSEIKKAEGALKDARETQAKEVKAAENNVVQKELEYTEGVARSTAVVEQTIKERQEGLEPLKQKLAKLETENSNLMQKMESLEKDYDRAYIDKELNAINDSWWNIKSDNQVRELLTKNRDFSGQVESIYPNSTVDQKVRMIKMMLSGFTLNADEQAILKLLEAAKDRGEIDAILQNPKTTEKRLDHKINGAENDQYHNIIGR